MTDNTITVYRDIVKGFSGSWSSGLGFLVCQHNSIPCDNGPTIRALDCMLDGQLIQSNHTIDNTILDGIDIVYSYDDYGLTLGGFTPYDTWINNGHPEIEIGHSVEIAY